MEYICHIYRADFATNINTIGGVYIWHMYKANFATNINTIGGVYMYNSLL